MLQVVEKGIAALATMAKSWENFLPEDTEQTESSKKWPTGTIVIGKSLSTLLQQTWLTPDLPMVSLILEFMVRNYSYYATL